MAKRQWKTSVTMSREIDLGDDYLFKQVIESDGTSAFLGSMVLWRGWHTAWLKNVRGVSLFEVKVIAEEHLKEVRSMYAE